MKRHIIFLSIAVISLASCGKDNQLLELQETDIVKESPVFHATTEGNTQTATKAYLNEDLKVLWNQSDLITIFNKTTDNEQYCFTGNEGDPAGYFKKVSGGSDSATTLNKVFAVYPYNPDIEINSNEVLTVLLPSEQNYKANSFGVGANTMVAVSENTDLSFRNLCGYLRLKLYGNNITIKKVSITGNHDEIIGGQATVTVDQYGIPTAQMITDSANPYISKKVSITCEDISLGTTSDTATEFCFVIPPVTFSNGFTLTVSGYKDGQYGSFVKSTSNSVAITRNVRRNMATLEVELEPLETVAFDDETFKAYCVANFDKDGDGEISIPEALDVTTIQCFNSSSTQEYRSYQSGEETIQEMYASSLKGIEEFENLEYLDISSSEDIKGPLKSLDLSQNTRLKVIIVNHNDIKELNIADMRQLESLECARTGITSLVLESIPNLMNFNCYGCDSLESLVLESIPKLTNFNCRDCASLESLTVKNCNIMNSVSWTGCDELKTLNLYGSTIISWPAGDMNVFPALQNLDISYTNYDNHLDLSCNGGIRVLKCESAGVTSIDIKDLPELQEINCSKNNIQTLDIRGCARLTKLAAWPQNEVNLESLVLSSTQAGNIELYDNTGEKTEAQINDIYHTVFETN